MSKRKDPNVTSNPWFKKGETNYQKLTKGLTHSPFNLLEVDGNEEALDNLIQYYDTIGRTQVQGKYDHFKNLRDLADGQINIKDFIKSEELQDIRNFDPDIQFDENSVDLEFFPITPSIVNRLVGEFDKKYLKFFARAVNPEAVNSIIEKRNEELKAMIQAEYMKFFNSGGQSSPEAQQEFKAKVEEKLKFYAKDYRTEIEEWAQHFMNICEQQFNLRQLTRDLFKERVVHEEPFIHINFQDTYFYPEIWKPENVFYVKSFNAKDASDYTMIGKYEFLDFNTILSRYQLNEKQAKQVAKWTEYYNGTSGFTPNGQYWFNNTNTRLQESAQNYITGKQLLEQTGREYVGTARLVRETIMYFIVPKKIGILTAVINGKTFVTEVDSNFKVTIKPRYRYTDKKKEDLIEGEHLEWTYINQLYKVIKLDMTFGSSYFESNHDFKPIYIFKGKHPIQYQQKSLRYGIKIPVHGGGKDNNSIVAKTAPWQKFYNYLWNRNKQLLSGEIGKFLLLNQNILPDRNLGLDTQEQSLLKSMVTARDMSILPTDLSLTNTGQLQAGAGVGQVIDLSKTSDILEKAQLAQAIKQECWDTIGLNPQTMADISPYQSAKSVAQTLDLTATQLQHLYYKHYDTMKYVWETMLETGVFLTSKGELRNLAYQNSDGQRIIFNLNEEHTLLTQFNIFPENDPNDIINLETIKQLAIMDNTMGADSYEKFLILSASSIVDVKTKLKEQVLKRDAQMQAQQQAEQEQQQKVIEAQKEQIMLQMENENRNKELDRQLALELKRYDALKYAQSEVSEMQKAIEEMNKFNESERSLEMQNKEFNLRKMIEETKLRNSMTSEIDQTTRDERFKMKELSIREKELEETKRRNNLMASQIKESNKNKSSD